MFIYLCFQYILIINKSKSNFIDFLLIMWEAEKHWELNNGYET